MIIFDLDGTLADCEHRRHFVDPSKRDDCEESIYYGQGMLHSAGWYYKDRFKMCEPPERMKFIPDWQAFYEACDKDEPIKQVINIFSEFNDDEYHDNDIEIWSGRCESVREKTEIWLKEYTSFGRMNSRILKMRPIGDSKPDDQLKEMWLMDALVLEGKTIDCVFDDRPKVIRMWRRRGIFVFDVNQTGKEF